MVVRIAAMGAVTASIASRLITSQEAEGSDPHSDRLRGLGEQVARLIERLERQSKALEQTAASATSCVVRHWPPRRRPTWSNGNVRFSTAGGTRRRHATQMRKTSTARGTTARRAPHRLAPGPHRPLAATPAGDHRAARQPRHRLRIGPRQDRPHLGDRAADLPRARRDLRVRTRPDHGADQRGDRRSEGTGATAWPAPPSSPRRNNG
jgi:hypothetical protein